MCEQIVAFESHAHPQSTVRDDVTFSLLGDILEVRLIDFVTLLI